MNLSRAIVATLLMATIAAAAASSPLRGGRHALLIHIGKYGNGMPRVPGTAQDIESARHIAGMLGIPGEHVTVLRDQEATSEGIRQAAAELALRLAPSDQVMLYFSGLGSQRADRDRPGGCEETFVAADGIHLSHADLASYFLPVAERAEKTVAFFDSCNTATSDIGSLAQRCIPPPAEQKCPANASRWRGFVTELRKSSVPTANIAAVLAARPQESAFGDAARGGLTGAALRECMKGLAKDTNQSGALSLAEIASCVQAAVDSIMTRSRAPQVQLAGNRDYAPFLAPGVSGERGALPALFDDLFAGRDGRRLVVLSPGIPPAGAPGRAVALRSSAVGYLYLLAAHADGSYSLLFPNADEQNNRLRPGAVFNWPRTGSGIAGNATVLAIVADNPRDTGMLPGAGRNPVVGDTAGREALFHFITLSVNGREPACKESGKSRNLSLARACSDAYGAAILVPGEP